MPPTETSCRLYILVYKCYYTFKDTFLAESFQTVNALL